jgi:hypothetical protein
MKLKNFLEKTCGEGTPTRSLESQRKKFPLGYCWLLYHTASCNRQVTPVTFGAASASRFPYLAMGSG